MKTSAFALVLVGSISLGACSGHDSSSDTSSETPRIDVAYPVVDSVMLHRTYPGYLTADKEVDLVARVDGYLVAHPYKAGDFVKAGTVLFQIEDRNYRDAVNQAEAALSTAQATLKYSESRYEAMKKALESDAVSEMEVEQAKSTLDEARASVSNAEAALRTARTTLSYCTVCAPFDGHVSNINYNEGAYLSGAGSPVVLATIYDDAVMTMNFSIEDEGYLELVNARQSTDLDLSAMPLKFSEDLPHSYTCDLSYLAPHINTATGTMTVQGSVKNPYNELKSGMYAQVELPYQAEPHAILILDSSIGTDQLGSYVYVVNDSNKVVYTPLKTGELYNDTLRIVNEGLTPQSRYVTKAMLKVRDGMEVEPVVRK